MKLGIVGAGVAGMAAALACVRAGVACELVDRAPDPLAGGVALTLWPHALRALQALGVDTGDAARFAPIAEGEIADMRGRVLYRLPLAWMKARFGFLPVCVRRQDLLSLMHQAAGAPRIERLEVRRVEQGAERVKVVSGVDVRSYDGLVLADGIRGMARRSVVQARLRPAHYAAWRGIARGVEIGPRMREIWGRGFRFGYAAMAAGDVYWFATLNCSRLGGAGDPAGSWRMLAALASESPPEVERLMANTPADAVYAHAIYDLAPGVPLAAGRVALLGDTAHAVTPNLGFGGGLALEDGAALLRALVAHQVADRPEELAPAFAAYARARRRRVAGMARFTRLMGNVMQWEGKAASAARDTVFRWTAPLGDRLVWSWAMRG